MAASATNVRAKSGGTWRTITAISAKSGGTWRTVQEVWAKSGGTWRHSWINSDPQTFEYDADWSQSYRENNNQRSTSYMYQGEYPSSSYGQQRSLMGFDYSDIQTQTATRPAIDAVTLRLSSDHWYNGDYNATLGYSRHGGHNYTSAPSTWDGSEVWQYSNGTYGHEETWSGGYAGARDQTKTITLPTGVGERFRDDAAKGLTLYARNTSTNYYAYFWGSGASASLRPRLSITCDYS